MGPSAAPATCGVSKAISAYDGSATVGARVGLAVQPRSSLTRTIWGVEFTVTWLIRYQSVASGEPVTSLAL